jgi:hypothetical protein
MFSLSSLSITHISIRGAALHVVVVIVFLSVAYLSRFLPYSSRRVAVAFPRWHNRRLDASGFHRSFKRGQLVRQQQERARIVQAEISSPIVAALFQIGSAKLQLETQALPEVKQITQASELLSEAAKKSVYRAFFRRNKRKSRCFRPD